MSGFTKGPWWADASHYGTVYIEANAVIDKRLLQEICAVGPTESGREQQLANARLISAAPELYEALKEARRAIGDHHAPDDCYATGPMTGDDYRDLVQCPACSFIAMYEAALSKAAGEGV